MDDMHWDLQTPDGQFVKLMILIILNRFCTQTIITGITPDLIDKIPGRANDRRTAMGELNWIFTGTFGIFSQ